MDDVTYKSKNQPTKTKNMLDLKMGVTKLKTAYTQFNDIPLLSWLLSDIIWVVKCKTSNKSAQEGVNLKWAPRKPRMLFRDSLNVFNLPKWKRIYNVYIGGWEACRLKRLLTLQFTEISRMISRPFKSTSNNHIRLCIGFSVLHTSNLKMHNKVFKFHELRTTLL